VLLFLAPTAAADGPGIVATTTTKPAIIKSPILYTWAYSPAFSVLERLTITNLPAAVTVALLCKGAGCPFSERSFVPTRPRLVLGSDFAGSHLSPKTMVTVEITATGKIGEVEVFSVRSGALPAVRRLCLPPRSKTPRVCV